MEETKENPGPKDDHKMNKKGRKPCLCGAEQHSWKKCWYLHPSLRPKDWAVDPEVQKRVDEELKKPYVRNIVEKLRKEVEDSKQPQATIGEAEIDQHAAYTAAFSSLGSTYPLFNSFILDSGATTHICNDPKWFTDLQPASGLLVAGENEATVKGYGTVYITLTRPSGEDRVKLGNVTFAPKFQTSIVSFC